MSQTEHRPVLIVIAGPNGKLFKRYTDDIPLWAQTIIG